MTAAYSTGPEATQSLRILAPSYAPQTVAREQEVNLFDLVERGPGAKLTPASVEIKDREKFFTAGVVDVGGETYKVPVDVAMRDAIVMGARRHDVRRTLRRRRGHSPEALAPLRADQADGREINPGPRRQRPGL